MRTIEITTTCRSLLADVFTPVGIYLRLRDKFRDTILLESTDHHSSENSWSFIGVNAIGGIEIGADGQVEFKFPARNPEKTRLKPGQDIASLVWDFMQHFEFRIDGPRETRFAQGLYGYTAYDAVQYFEQLEPGMADSSFPLMRYRLYQYVIAIDHFRDALFICENKTEGLPGDPGAIESLIRNRDVPTYPFAPRGEERSNMSDEDYKDMVKKGISSCHRGDVFQIVLSRRFQRSFTGDEFNVYRALRSINPSPYLFFFDYGDYKLFGSSPEAQLQIRDRQAVIHPIAGTFRRTGDEETDKAAAERLLEDAKENAEHVMLVDLARNDLSRSCEEVTVTHYRQVQYFSHVIHLVSEVTGRLPENSNPFALLAATFPAGTLSGAPKYRAIELIRAFEPTSRGFYGGTIGFAGFDGSFNHAIMIRTFLSRENNLICQAGAGVVAASVPENELAEVNNKLGALKKAIEQAAGI